MRIEFAKRMLVKGRITERQIIERGYMVYPDPEGDLVVPDPTSGIIRRAQLVELEPADFRLVPLPIGSLPDKL